MIVNGKSLYAANPITGMLQDKHRAHGVSYGLTEAGYDLRIAEAVTMHPFKRFSLSFASEPFAMPTDLVGIVHDKSTWARRGLSVFNTVIEPGWFGVLTLELVYHGSGILRIPVGAGIAQVIFHRIEVPATYSGKYQGQSGGVTHAIFE